MNEVEQNEDQRLKWLDSKDSLQVSVPHKWGGKGVLRWGVQSTGMMRGSSPLSLLTGADAQAETEPLELWSKKVVSKHTGTRKILIV